MLKALELVGFKSFADRTRIDFPPGVTAIVGPNGSGKSNVVDAIKWVLGEQSVKSLRGREMVDCIFNGSGTRAPVQSAEVTLVLDNARRLLPIEAPEVHVTRRVYRSGEGEYLINRQPSRLRDVRELFMGTGISTEAYSVIEQGKVDVLLQASPKDRRAIFEEAAGIRRFKAKKVESLRRLERVDQNLLRLSDIVDEVESRLRSIRTQASKARRYQEMVDRLQQMRTALSMGDWLRLTDRLRLGETTRREAEIERERLLAESQRLEGELGQVDSRNASAEDVVRERETNLALLRQRIAANHASMAHEFARLEELATETSRLRRQWSALQLRAGDVRQQLDETESSVASAESRVHECAAACSTEESRMGRISAELAAARAALEGERGAQLNLARGVASNEAQRLSLESRVSAARAAEADLGKRADEITDSLARISTETAQLETEIAGLRREEGSAADELSRLRAELTESRGRHERLATDLTNIRQEHARVVERATVLEELEARLEGIGAGTRQVVEIARSTEGSALGFVGMVADLMQVRTEFAPLVDVALGDLSQHIVVQDLSAAAACLEKTHAPLAGRVTLLAASAVETARRDLSREPGVVARFDTFAQCAPRDQALIRGLLGDTWLVESLDVAFRLAADGGDGKFVTREGTLVSSGVVSLGPARATAGLLSRRSELRSSRTRADELTSQAARQEAELAATRAALAVAEQRVERLAARRAQVVASLADKETRRRAIADRASQCQAESTRVNAEIASSRLLAEAATERIEQVRATLAASESQLAAIEARSMERTAAITELDARRRACEDTVVAARVAWAKAEERLGSLRTRKLQIERDQQDRDAAIEECRSQLEDCGKRHAAATLGLLAAESAAAALHLESQSETACLAIESVSREERRATRAKLFSESQRVAADIHAADARLHQADLAVREVRLERLTLATRLREDYGIELESVAETPSAIEGAAPSREEAEREIADLRRKVQQLGNVNLEALDELTDLEARYATLKAQHDDLAKTKRTLERIIAKIDQDSRRLFAETLETVKGHFQELFRKLFGGGHADIVLEEGVDLLDSGIEIIARPPGKEPRGISLLSGGEKTLTCVALLLAVFQFRPSPFCVLDEVDAALDEANIERFAGVLQEFLIWTQFIVVTHSKKTMTCATTLHGVTMQESGVSKHVSVRFEDVRENGEIAQETRRPSGDETQAA